VTPRFRQGDRIRQWTLLDPLGEGGNGEVWKATDGRSPVALKIVARKPHTDSYRRFVNEVEASRRFGELKGVLPVLESYLPAQYKSGDPPAIAMRIATPVRKALSGKPLGDIVQAVRAFAETLAEIHAAGGGHRDIKPGNLYRYRQRWVIGDFGLVDLPDLEAITRTGRIGPAGFMPDELFLDAKRAESGPVDVFQLAKTLVVLVTEQEFPPQGPIAAGSSGAISRYVTHAHADDLDQLVERCTRPEPTDRPDMHSVAKELDAWLSEPHQPQSNLEAAAARFRSAHAGALSATARIAAQRASLAELGQSIRETIALQVVQVLKEAGLNPELGAYDALHEWVERRRSFGVPSSIAEDQVWVVAEWGDPMWPRRIAVGIGWDLDEDGQCWCQAILAAGDLESAAHRRWLTDEQLVPIDSRVRVRTALSDLRTDVLDALAALLNSVG